MPNDPGVMGHRGPFGADPSRLRELRPDGNALIPIAWTPADCFVEPTAGCTVLGGEVLGVDVPDRSNLVALAIGELDERFFAAELHGHALEGATFVETTL